MKIKKIRCTTCGGEIEISSRFSKIVKCRYCDTVYTLDNNKLESSGIVSEPFEPLSMLEVRKTYNYKDKIVKVLGRIRLQSEGDIWDEWYVLIDGIPYWIEESSDLITLFSSKRLRGIPPKFDKVQVGTAIELGKDSFIIIEKGRAEVIGIEGEFTGRIKPGENYKYIQGNSEDKVYALEFYPEEIKLLKGEDINPTDIKENESF
jgi:hypothetical protein